jgi:hypothetical protein
LKFAGGQGLFSNLAEAVEGAGLTAGGEDGTDDRVFEEKVETIALTQTLF